MAELENVIYSIERCICHIPDACRDCGYDNEPCPKCFEHLLRDAHDLLKEEEPIQMEVLEDYGSIKFGDCPKCKSFINNRSYPKSCGCGQKVKWDE